MLKLEAENAMIYIFPDGSEGQISILPIKALKDVSINDETMPVRSESCCVHLTHRNNKTLTICH